MSKESKLSLLLKQSPITVADLQRKSSNWFAEKASEFFNVRSIREETLMRGDQNRKSNNVMPGDLYLYIYEAKHAKTLPYWDRFPLVFPFRTTPNGFYGLNLHYLPYALRAELLEKLLQYTNDSSMSENTRLRVKWQTLAAFSQFSPAKVCVKQYLFSQLRSPFKKIHPSDWITAMFLPMERFQSATAQEVWADSIKKLNSLDALKPMRINKV